MAGEIDRCQAFFQRLTGSNINKRTAAPWAVLAQALLMSNEMQYID